MAKEESDMTKREQMVREEISQILINNRFGLISTAGAIPQILKLADSKGNKLVGIIAEDQSVPDNLVWQRNERHFEAYCAGRVDMLNAGFVKLIKE